MSQAEITALCLQADKAVQESKWQDALRWVTEAISLLAPGPDTRRQLAELYAKRSNANFGQQEAGPSVYDAMMSLLLSQDPYFENEQGKPANFDAWNRLALAYVQMEGTLAYQRASDIFKKLIDYDVPKQRYYTVMLAQAVANHQAALKKENSMLLASLSPDEPKPPPLTATENTWYVLGYSQKKSNAQLRAAENVFIRSLVPKDAPFEMRDGIAAGRGLFATRDIPEAEVIFSEVPWAVGCRASGYCAMCLKLLEALPPTEPPVPCEACGEKYCSEACRVQAEQTYHPQSCGANLQPLVQMCEKGTSSASKMHLLVHRIIATLETQRANSELALNNSMRLSSLQTPYHSKVHVDLQRDIGADLSLVWEVRRALPQQRLSSRYDFEWQIDVLLKLINNTFTIPGMKDPFANRGDMAAGLFSLAAMFNHSCAPNVAYRIRTAGGVKMEFMARKPIKAGEELFISYFNPTMPLQQRREKLLQYGFLCRCTRCQSEEDAE